MRRVKSIIFAMLIAIVIGFAGLGSVLAATNLPSSIKTADLTGNGKYKTVNYINATAADGKKYTYPIIVKKTTEGKYVYCMELDSTFSYNLDFKKTGKVDDGFISIINANLNTGDANKDFYIKQLAVWYYMDYVNGNNANLEPSLKNYIIYHSKDSKRENYDVCKKVIDLLNGAISYKQATGSIDLVADHVTFSIVDGYYVSSEIVVKANNVKNIKYSLTNTPKGSQVVKSTNGVKVKVPVSAIAAGQKLTFKLNVKADSTKETAYYYFHSAKYQKLLYSETETSTINHNDELEMVIANVNYTVNISKTDVTQAKEVAGATLEVKDEKGTLIEKWISTNETHKITLQPGKYSLTETIAPAGYKLSKTTINFMIDVTGKIYVKDSNGVYTKVDKVVMINELEDQVSIAKLDSETGKQIAGAKLVIKDSNGYVVSEFTSTDKMYSITLKSGVYTLYEVEAPQGYQLSKDVVTFKLLDDGTVQVLNGNGKYEDVVYVSFYNTKKPTEEVEVPSTGKNATLLLISGLALLIGGAIYVKKSIKEC
ncbi:MAG: LPXTG cell wall anchor domain-containing protein [Bacilli bacterium]|nr:LPXTG cell wall anchor domain-containing protein [Bacilli bacterium]